MEYSEKTCICALANVFGYEPRVAHELVNTLGSARAVFEMNEKERTEVLGPFSKYSSSLNGTLLESTEEELSRLENDGCKYITILDNGYPELLSQCDDAPLGFYLRGISPPEDVFGKPAVAVVGTRDISMYGHEWCRRIVGALGQAPAKPLIVSGLALGTDITAHEAALEAGLATAAVLPTGIDAVYPRRHTATAARIAATAGCGLITDYPPATPPVAINFIRRNRIIAGLCGATILIESRQKGGGIITARLAASYDRDIYALPGRIDDPRSQGCNMLIREQIAAPITDLSILIESLGLGSAHISRRNDIERRVESTFADTLDTETLAKFKTVARRIRSERGITVEDLAHTLDLPYQEVSQIVGMLESCGLVSTDLLQRCSINVKIV